MIMKRRKRKQASGYGQHGDRLVIHPSKLNENERRVWHRLVRAGRNTLTLDQLGVCFAKLAGDETRANSWARNSLRRLVRGGFVEAVGRGLYRAGQPHFLAEERKVRRLKKPKPAQQKHAA